MWIELAFAATSLVLLVAGTKLARYGEAIAEKSRVSVTWVGLFLVAAVTSFPEVVTGLSSIVVVDEPDLAAGDVLGSCLVNLALAATAGIVVSSTPSPRAEVAVYRTGCAYFLVMLAAVAAGLAGSVALGLRRSLGVASAFLVLAYLAGIRHVFHVQSRRREPPGAAKFGDLTSRRVTATFAASGFVVIAAASLLPWLAQRLAIERGLATSFVGTAFLAAATSLPELVVVIAALRQGTPGLAIGGLVGSNLFDLVILAIDDLFYTKGPLLAAIAAEHLATVGLIGAATALLLLGLPPDREPRRAPLAGVILAYAAALALSARGFR